jgi:hypothetical protein
MDSEGIIGHYLRTHPDVKALKARVLGQTPGKTDTTEPWVQVTLLDPQNVTGNSRVEQLVSYYLQLDCYAGGGEKVNTSAAAFELADAVRSALLDAIGQVIGADGEAVVTDVRPVSMPRIPDADFEPARQRYMLDIEVFMRPARAGEGS